MYAVYHKKLVLATDIFEDGGIIGRPIDAKFLFTVVAKETQTTSEQKRPVIGDVKGDNVRMINYKWHKSIKSVGIGRDFTVSKS